MSNLLLLLEFYGELIYSTGHEGSRGSGDPMHLLRDERGLTTTTTHPENRQIHRSSDHP